MGEGCLFVYGSMTEGMVHHRRVMNFIEQSSEGQVRGRVHRLEVGFPALTLDGGDPVPGSLLVLRDFDTLVKILDEMHGYSSRIPEKSLFVRTEVDVTTPEGVQKAWVYAMEPSRLPKTATVIEGGNWKVSLEERQPLTTGLTRNQKVYIQRLGRSSGRDIVPINLDLYRELMGKGLIIDKGRRLALTPLGQECFYFIEDQP